jgi:hypothetical protein
MSPSLIRRLSIPPRRDALLSIKAQSGRRAPTSKFIKYTESLARHGRQPYPLVKRFESSALVVGHQSELGAERTGLSQSGVDGRRVQHVGLINPHHLCETVNVAEKRSRPVEPIPLSPPYREKTQRLPHNGSDLVWRILLTLPVLVKDAISFGSDSPDRVH